MQAESKSHVFISHASDDRAVVRSVAKALGDGGVRVWLDSEEIQLGLLLRNELHEAIRQSAAVVLVWSEAAYRSRWVSAEILTAFHMDRFIFPCVADETPLPQFLANSIYLNLRKNRAEVLRRLTRGVGNAPAHANPLPPLIGSSSGELKVEIERIYEAQQLVTRPLMNRDLTSASAAQARLDPVMKGAEQRWKFELAILNLGGYHRKNGYLVKHWDAVQAGRPPKDPLLREGERLFFEAALVDPLNVSALNGLASILIYELELDAAEFFNERAIAISKKQGIAYDAAMHDQRLIAWLKQQQGVGRRPEGKGNWRRGGDSNPR